MTVSMRPHSRFAALVPIALVLSLVLVVFPAVPDKAQASHLRGGLITAEYHVGDGGSHVDEVHLTASMLATVASPEAPPTPTVKILGAGGALSTPSGTCSIVQNSSVTDTASNPLFSISTKVWTISGCLGTAGQYIFYGSTGNRISGIDNTAYSARVQYEVVLNIDGATDSAAPTFSSGYMYNIAYSSSLDYSTNLNALGQGNTSVAYELMTNTSAGPPGYGASQIPCSDLNTSTGQFRINASLCAGSDTIAGKFGLSEIYALKVKATDVDGQFATRDVLLQFATTSNNAPVFSSTSPAPGPLTVIPGSTQTITVSATDVDADTVDFTENLSKSWITESSVSTSGTGASTVFTKVYTLAPPLGTSETVQFEISAYDDDAFSLSSQIQYDIEAGGVLPPGTPGTPTLVAGAGALTVSFTAPNSGGSVASYRADVTLVSGGSAVQYSCSAPPATSCSITSLQGVTAYSVVIVAVNASGTASSYAATATTLAAAVSSGGSSGGSGSESSTPAPQQTPTPEPAPTPRAQTPAPAQEPVSGPVLRGNVPPTPTSAPTATVGGRPTTATTRVAGPANVNIRAGVFSLGVRVASTQGVVTQGAGGTTQLEVKKGTTAALSGTGGLPGSTVQVFLPLQGGNAKELTRIPVDDTGSFSGNATFSARANEPPMPVGKQVLQIVSTNDEVFQTVVEMTVNIAQSVPEPERNRSSGEPPELTPGRSIATDAGVPTAVTVTPRPAQKQVTVEGNGWRMAVDVPASEGGVVETPDGGALLELVRDEAAVVSGDGFMPGTRADVWLFSDPTLLGSVEIDSEGKFNGQVLLDSNVVITGEHTLQLQGVGKDGYVKAANLGVLVKDPAVPVATQEAASGFLWWVWLLAGLLIVAVVTTLVVRVRALARARRKSH